MNLSDEVPKHLKRSGKKPFVLLWEWHGDESKIKSRIDRSLLRDWKQRYATERAATQALEAWRNGGGGLGQLCRPPIWSCTLIKEQ